MSYNKAIKGKLMFKGDSGSSKKVRKVSTSTRTDSSSSDSNTKKETSSNAIEVCIGSGRLSSSGITIQGYQTKFMEELSAGDAIIVTHPTSLAEETKIVKMVLSNIAIGISSAFSTDLISTTGFRYIKAPKGNTSQTAEEVEASDNKQKKRKSDSAEVDAFGTYASSGGEKIVYRVKKPGAYGGYSIVTETADSSGGTSRESLLAIRSKKKADRHCY